MNYVKFGVTKTPYQADPMKQKTMRKELSINSQTLMFLFYSDRELFSVFIQISWLSFTIDA